jgi:hypothetical protein
MQHDEPCLKYCTSQDQISLRLIGDIGNTFVQIATAIERPTIDDRAIIKSRPKTEKAKSGGVSMPLQLPMMIRVGGGSYLIYI